MSAPSGFQGLPGNGLGFPGCNGTRQEGQKGSGQCPDESESQTESHCTPGKPCEISHEPGQCPNTLQKTRTESHHIPGNPITSLETCPGNVDGVSHTLGTPDSAVTSRECRPVPQHPRKPEQRPFTPQETRTAPPESHHTPRNPGQVGKRGRYPIDVPSRPVKGVLAHPRKSGQNPIASRKPCTQSRHTPAKPGRRTLTPRNTRRCPIAIPCQQKNEPF
jgi:hypothetical protein|mmetsp:Transcript_1821/g.3035  ORF Transcript_1821/g.3035 Transcript_1821/m.3035 type:complete len:219 (+) Transcript_1821:678-1334(+)